jgi:predicted alternative tryptophan synthase beta-subunit
MSPQVSLLKHENIIEAVAVSQTGAFEAGVIFAKTEGIIPAPETTPAIKAAIDEALKCKQTGEKKIIAFNFSGHGHLDLGSYEQYLDGKLEDFKYPAEKVKESLSKIPKF